MEEEIWKDIPEWEGYYQVSSLGRVRSLDRVILKSNGVDQKSKGRLIRSYCNKGNGYLAVRLSIIGKMKTLEVHHLVAKTFLNLKPDRNYAVVDHIDGDKLNNRLDNLQIITHRENTVKGVLCKDTISGYVGVASHYNRWAARIRLLGSNQIYLSSEPTPEKAHELYKKALNKFNSDIKYYKEEISHLSNKEKREYLLN